MGGRTTTPIVTIDQIVAAETAITGRVLRTPAVQSPALSDRLGVPVVLKLELLQKTGCFKPRGITNRLLALQQLALGVELLQLLHQCLLAVAGRVQCFGVGVVERGTLVFQRRLQFVGTLLHLVQNGRQRIVQFVLQRLSHALSVPPSC